MGDFLNSLNQSIENVRDSDDNYVVCDAMHSAETKGQSLLENELHAAFATAKSFGEIRPLGK